MIALALLLSSVAADASGLSVPQSGPSLDFGAGGSGGGVPFRPGVAGVASFGWWFGKYDDSYAIGRYTFIGATGRGDWIPVGGGDAAIRVAPMLEVRRGLELIVAGAWFGLAGGPLLTTVTGTGPSAFDTGGTARLAIGAELRRHRFWGFTLRLEGGADFAGGAVGANAALLLGFQFSRPARSLDRRGSR